MAERLYYCEICKVPLAGAAPAQQHYAGQKHRKRYEALKAAAEIDSTFNKVIIVPCGSEDVLVRPYDQQLLTNSKDQSAFHNRVPDGSSPYGKLAQNSVNAGKTEVAQTQCKDELSASRACQEEKKHYEMFDGIRGCCYLCKVEFTSVQHAKQHLSGQKHLKEVRVAEAQKKFYGNSAAVSHQQQITDNFGNSSSCSSAAGRSFQQQHLPSSSLCSYSGFDSGQKVDDVATTSGFKKTDNQYLPGTYPERQFPAFDDQSLSLSLNLKEDSLTSFCPSNDGPFKGDLNPKPTPQNPFPYECHICNKKMNSLEQLILHKNSHQSKSAPVNQTGIDNTIWFPCPHCGKSLNSVKSLRVHFMDAHKMTSKEIDNYFDQIGTHSTKSLPEILPKSDMFRGNNHVNDKYKEQSNSNSHSENPLLKQHEMNMDSNKIAEEHRLDLDLSNLSVNQDSKDTRLALALTDHRQKMSRVETDGNHVELVNLPGSAICKGCGKNSCLFHCHVCNICLNSVKQRQDHEIGSQHIKKFHGTSITLSDARYYCSLCNASMNTQTDYDRHMKGQQHALNVTRKVPAPVRGFGPEPSESLDICYQGILNLTTSKPRSYQVELYEKAMKTDTVCFLPTGTGKTLVSILVMSHMLQKYTGRPVVFLVDKILLVLQQYEEIKKEIGNKLYKRWNESKGCLEERELRIAMLCRGKQDLNENEVWQQDVIVITAAYYCNLLDSGSLRWTDNCLVVFDEAHHCVKKHPYKQILQTVKQKYNGHPSLPRILGLTASPAGRNTVKDTLVMLRQLLSDFGNNAKLITVEGINELKELQSFQSNTELLVELSTRSDQETTFCDALCRYILECWLRLKQTMTLKPREELEAQFGILGNTTEENISKYLQRLNSDTASQLAEGLDSPCDLAKEDVSKRAEQFFLQSHIKYFCQLLTTLETLGMELVIKDLHFDYVQTKSNFGSFITAAELNLPCEKLQALINNYTVSKAPDLVVSHVEVSDQKGENGKESFLPVVNKLVTLIIDRFTWIDKNGDKPLALILVRRRKDATRLTEMLKEDKLLNERNMKVVSVTGHGSGKDGMTVSQQEKILTDIREHKYQVIVATSVAEEGLDMPLCELVVQLNPPDTVRALVQIRGRARKKGSQFIAFCQTEEQKNSFEELLKHEEHMITAVKQLIDCSNIEQ